MGASSINAKTLHFNMKYYSFNMSAINNLSHDNVTCKPGIMQCVIDEENSQANFIDFFVGNSTLFYDYTGLFKFNATIDFVKENDIYYFYADRIELAGEKGSYTYYLKNKDSFSNIPDDLTGTDDNIEIPSQLKDKIVFILKDDNLKLVIPNNQILIQDICIYKTDSSLSDENKYACIVANYGKRIIDTCSSPEGEDFEQWTMTYCHTKHKGDIYAYDEVDYLSRIVYFAFEDENVYLGNLDDNTPDSWLKGYIEDNKIIFPAGQMYYMSSDSKSHAVPYYEETANQLFFIPAEMWLQRIFPSYNLHEDADNHVIINEYQASTHGRLWFNVVPKYEDLTFDFDSEKGIISNPTSDFLFDENCDFTTMKEDVLEYTYIKPEIGTYCDISFERGAKSFVPNPGAEVESRNNSELKFYNLQGIFMGNDINVLSPGIYIKLDSVSSRLIKK